MHEGNSYVKQIDDLKEVARITDDRNKQRISDFVEEVEDEIQKAISVLHLLDMKINRFEL